MSRANRPGTSKRCSATSLRPIEPPERLSRADRGHLHGALGGGGDRAVGLGRGALRDSELRALRDPRNWVRPVVAVGVGGVATGALVLFELRRRGKHEANGLKGLASGVRDRTPF